jgi:hypothetical protein
MQKQIALGGCGYTTADCFSIGKQTLFLHQSNEDSCLLKNHNENTR